MPSASLCVLPERETMPLGAQTHAPRVSSATCVKARAHGFSKRLGINAKRCLKPAGLMQGTQRGTSRVSTVQGGAGWLSWLSGPLRLRS